MYRQNECEQQVNYIVEKAKTENVNINCRIQIINEQSKVKMESTMGLLVLLKNRHVVPYI